MSSKLVFVVKLPDPSAPDVVSRRVTAVLNGLEILYDGTISPEISTLGPFTGHDNDSVHVTLVDIDDAGNLSPVRSVQFVLQDMIAPPMPDQPAIDVIAESHEKASQPVETVFEVPVVAEAAVEVTVPIAPVHEELAETAEAETEEATLPADKAQEGPVLGPGSGSEAESGSEIVERQEEAQENESEAISEHVEVSVDEPAGGDEETEKQEG